MKWHNDSKMGKSFIDKIEHQLHKLFASDFTAIYHIDSQELDIISNVHDEINSKELCHLCDFLSADCIAGSFKQTYFKIGKNDLIVHLLNEQYLLIIGGKDQNASLILSRLTELESINSNELLSQEPTVELEPIIDQEATKVSDEQLPVMSNCEVLSEFFTHNIVFNKPLNTVGGDFYWFEQEAEKLLFIIGDCKENGIKGAMFVKSLYAIIETVKNHEGNLPEELIENIYKHIIKEGGNSRMNLRDNKINTELGVGLYDKQTATLSFVSSGISFIHSSGSKTEFLKNKKIINFQDTNLNERFTHINLKLVRQDKLYFFTDGIMRAYDDLGERKLGKRGAFEMAKRLDTRFTLEDVQKEFKLENGSDRVVGDDMLLLGFEV